MSDSRTGPPAGRGASILPSVNFLLLLLVFTGVGAALWHGWAGGRLAVFAFVVTGWVVSLCLHEFGHAATAYLGGDKRIASTGYLSLDPLKYTDPALSIILPLIYIFLGGFGLPGGAVYVRTASLRNRAWDVAVAAAGPLANLVMLLLLGLLYAVAPDDDPSDFQAAVAVLAFFQATAIVLNLLPFPGLDGFGILRPFLPGKVAATATTVGAAGFFILVALLWFTSIGIYVFDAGIEITKAVGISRDPIARGYAMIKLL